MAATAFSRQAPGQVLYTPALQASLRRLDSLVDWERRLRAPGAQRAMRVDTKPASALLAAIGSPHKSFRAVHVTGSKGKGSVSWLVGAALAASGARTGIYGSPHVERVNERVRLNGAQIGDDALAEALDVVLNARERHAVDATWFDVVSAAGMFAFHTAGVDWAVVEVGMGGRLDSTNVLNAPVVVVTNIALEHQDIIGPTVRDIAYEKAGIITRGCQVIVGMDAAHDLASIFRDEAMRVGAAAPLFMPPGIRAPIKAHNVALARLAIGCALPDTDPVALLPDVFADEVLSSLPGRMEHFAVTLGRGCDGQGHGRVEAVVKVTLDGAHVADSVRRVLEEVLARNSKPPVVVLALGREKDAAGICNAIVSTAPAQLIATSAGCDLRYLPAADLAAVARHVGADGVLAYAEAEDALTVAIQEADRLSTHVVVIGSLHLAGRLRPLLVASAADKDQTPTIEKKSA
jgi:dihydrofolate synthase / folylpolyglutamate synthase